MKRHTVHTKHPRYKVPNYPRGRGGGERTRTTAQRDGLRDTKPIRRPKSIITYNTEFDYWAIDNNVYPDGLKWGFDLSSVGNKKAYRGFLKKNKFKVIEKAKSRKKGDQPVIYKNPDGVLFIVSKEISERDSAVFLGYVALEAPKGKSKELNKVLTSFRGRRQLTFKRHDETTWDYQGSDIEGGVASYVKEESPHSRDFI